jgi:hypothetical protein
MKDIEIKFTRFFCNPIDKRTIRNGINFKAGVYFWFTNGQSLEKLKIPISDKLFRIERDNKPLYLIYIGIGPSNENSKQVLKKRIASNHLGNKICNSTLRQSISALIGHKPFNKKVGKNMKIFVESDSEREITDLITNTFSFGVLEHNAPWTIENKFIQTYEPPINLAGNQNGWFYISMKKRRDIHRERGKKNVR